MNAQTIPAGYGLILTAFGSFVKKLRNDRGEKLQTVSRALCITHPVISKIENGCYTSLSYSIVARLLDYYKVPLSQLLTYMIEQVNVQEGRPPQSTEAMLSIINEAAKLMAKIQQMNNGQGPTA